MRRRNIRGKRCNRHWQAGILLCCVLVALCSYWYCRDQPTSIQHSPPSSLDKHTSAPSSPNGSLPVSLWINLTTDANLSFLFSMSSLLLPLSPHISFSLFYHIFDLPPQHALTNCLLPNEGRFCSFHPDTTHGPPLVNGAAVVQENLLQLCLLAVDFQPTLPPPQICHMCPVSELFNSFSCDPSNSKFPISPSRLFWQYIRLFVSSCSPAIGPSSPAPLSPALSSPAPPRFSPSCTHMLLRQMGLSPPAVIARCAQHAQAILEEQMASAVSQLPSLEIAGQSYEGDMDPVNVAAAICAHLPRHLCSHVTPPACCCCWWHQPSQQPPVIQTNKEDPIEPKTTSKFVEEVSAWSVFWYGMLASAGPSYLSDYGLCFREQTGSEPKWREAEVARLLIEKWQKHNSA
eukprot:GHVS01035545.1.p1 GENE.GHVS01035545.1~~GHVS01035545.1.p1  ORF type:complete len:403 (+),score=52.57 GHVS01035545.1:849-2057(+)